MGQKESLPDYYGKKEPSDRAAVRPTAVAPQLMTRSVCLSVYLSVCPNNLCAQFFPHLPYTVQVASRGFFTWLESPRGPRPPRH
jgi:hypothetical protein